MWRSRGLRDSHCHPGKHDKTHNRAHSLPHLVSRKRNRCNSRRGTHERLGRQEEVINAEEIAKVLKCFANGFGWKEVDVIQKVKRGNREWEGSLIGTRDEGARGSWSTCKHHKRYSWCVWDPQI